MKILRRLFFVALLIVLLAVAWIWWNRPQRADMAGYAPASTLIYLESNSLMDVADGISSTDSWKVVKPFIGETKSNWATAPARRLVAWTGIGPTPSVILARAQVAMVMLDLGAREQGDTITLKPEAALLIETHTSQRRIQATVEEVLGKFAERSYRQPSFKRSKAEGDEFLIWTSPENNREIVAVIDGSLVIVANSQRAAKACLEARRGQRPSLRSDSELQQMRTNLSADSALAFGFVSSAHSGELLSLGTPLLFGRAPGGMQFDSVIAKSAPKILGSAGWSTRRVDGAIEDHYFFALQSSVLSRMRPLFQNAIPPSSALRFVPEEVHSVTIYGFKEPAETWRGLQSTLSSQLDTLSAILSSSVLKSALLPYGIEDPEKFLHFVGPEIMTARLKSDAPGSILIAQVREDAGLRELLKNSTRIENAGSVERQLAVHFQDGYVLIGSPEDVRRCAQFPAGNSRATPSQLMHFRSDPTSNITTYTNDEQRVVNFISALVRAQGKSSKVSEATELNQEIRVPYSITETSLSDLGLNRRTRSAFGQFSALVPMLFPTD